MFEVLSRMYVVAMRIAQGVDLARAAECPDAPQIDISLVLEVWDLEVAQHGDAVIVWIVVMPLEALRVNEEHDIGEVLVIIDEVSAW